MFIKNFTMNKQNKFFVILTIFFCLSLFYLQQKNFDKSNKIKIGLVLPIQNKIIEKIKDSFCSEFQTNNHFIDYQNSMGDQILQHNIIKNMLEKNYDFIVTIGTAAGEVALALCQKLHFTTKIIALNAQNIDEKDITKNNNYFFVENDVSMPDVFKFISDLNPTLKHLTIFYSSQEKSIANANLLEELTKTKEITLKKIIVQTLIDLSTLVKTLDEKTEMIFVPKDLLIMNGISSILKKCKEFNIPVVVSDENSMREGASIGLGIEEAALGSIGAQVIKKIINKKLVQNVIKYKNKKLFVNSKTSSFFSKQLIKKIAIKNKIPLLFIQTLEEEKEIQ